jgi:hypothetical protein
MGGGTRAILLAGAAVATVGAGVGVAALLKAREARPPSSGDANDPAAPPDPAPAATADGSTGAQAEGTRAHRARFAVPPPEQLSRQEILAAMTKVKPKVHACFSRFRQPGILTVRMTVAGSGRVTSAHAEGTFAGSETGKCAESAAKGAWFRGSHRPAATIVWPFVLR